MKSATAIMGALTAAVVISTSTAWAQAPQPTQPDRAPQPSAAPGQPGAMVPQSLEGQVVAIDPARGIMTIRAADGTVHQFRGSAETLREYQVGDQIALTLRGPAGR